MNVLTFFKMPFSHRAGWQALKSNSPSIPTLAWCVVLPMSLLPPLMSIMQERIMAIPL